jgi:tetratricopeptide (TPR) repeat protein
MQGRYREAEPLYKRALMIREKVLEEGHPSIATTLSDLASLYRAQGRYGEAEPLYRRALSINEKVLGLERPETMASKDSLHDLPHEEE